MEHRLRDAPVEPGGDPEHASAAPSRRDRLPLHRRRSVRPRPPRLADPPPVRSQRRQTLFRRPPLAAGTPRVLTHSSPRRLPVLWLAELRPEAARARAPGAATRRRGFLVLRHGTFERHGRSLASSCGPSPPGGAATTASADFSLRPSRGVALSDARRALPRSGHWPSPPARRIDAHGSWSRALRGRVPARPAVSASPPVSVRQPAAALHASFSLDRAVGTWRFAWVPATGFPKDSHLQVSDHAGHTRSR